MAIEEVTRDRTYVIAEIGACHQGDLGIARELIDVAAEAGCDAVKFQKRCLVPGALFSAEELARPYAGEHAFGATYGDHRAALEFGVRDIERLAAYAYNSCGLDTGVSVWDMTSARECVASRAFAWVKIPSACVTWPALVEYVMSTAPRVIASVGACSEDDVIRLTDTIESHKPKWVALMQCTSAYPCEFEDVNLEFLAAMIDTIEVADAFGLSGHHRGIAVDVAAVAVGAQIIERHITLDRTMRGTDHAAALEPAGLKTLVRDIRAVEAAIGTGDKRVLPCEVATMAKLRTSVML